MSETKMQYRRLGRAGMVLSEVGLGSWLTYGGGVAEDTAAQCILTAYDQGVNFFDTANAYIRGEAEKVVGKVLRELPRDTFVLATKLYFPMREGANASGLSRKHIREQCDASLRRLGLDYIDLYQCHRWDANTPVEETIIALEDLVRAGKILYYGVSEWSALQIQQGLNVAQSRGFYGLVSNQPCYNMLARGIEHELVPMCEKAGVGQVVYSPLAQGVLTGKYLPGQAPPEGTRAVDPKQNIFLAGRELMHDTTLEKVQRLKPIAEKVGLTMGQLALAWILRLPNITSVIIGASRPEQIKENVAASGVNLPAEIVEEIEAALGG